MTVAYLSVGSNIGDRLYHLVEAVRALRSYDGVEVLAVSSIYETTPVGYADQADFLNVAVCVETAVGARGLLDVCQQIEQELGRERTIRWGPRTVDLDILLYGTDTIEAENLIVPHPRMHERAFVLIPLLEITPLIAHPTSPGKLYSEVAAVRDSGVVLWKKIEGVEYFLQLKG